MVYKIFCFLTPPPAPVPERRLFLYPLYLECFTRDFWFFEARLRNHLFTLSKSHVRENDYGEDKMLDSYSI